MEYGWLGICIVLASWLGFELIAKVPCQLHTPLMSGTNAISGITIIGAFIALSRTTDCITTVLAYGGIFFATLNIVGGYIVTDRMLKMFHTKDKENR